MVNIMLASIIESILLQPFTIVHLPRDLLTANLNVLTMR
jgi:hypothetical protein